MKAKSVVLTVVGGVIVAGAAVASICEMKRLLNVISIQKEGLKGSLETAAAQDETIRKKDEEIAALNDVIIAKDEMIALQEQMIALHEEEVAILKNSQETSEEPKPTTEPLSFSEDSLGDLEPPKKQVYKPEYIFQYDSDFKVVGKYKSAAEACDKAGIQYAGNLRKVFAGVNATAAGYFWSKGTKPLKQFPARWIKAADSMKKRELERAKNEKEEN